MTENFSMIIDGIPCEISGRRITTIHDPAAHLVITFIKDGNGGNYMGRRNTCECCREIPEDWVKFWCWEQLADYFPEGSWLYLYEIVARDMCNEGGTAH